MSSRRPLDYGARLAKLDELGSGNATAIVGPSPSQLVERLNAAERLEADGTKAPLARVMGFSVASEGIPFTTLNSQGFRPYCAGGPVQVGDRLVLDVGCVTPNPLTPRAFYLDADLKDRSISLANDGQLQAIQVYLPSSDGLFELHDGESRWRSLQLVGRPTVNAEVVERHPNPLVRFKQARTLNTERKSQTVFDDAVRFTELLSHGVVGAHKDLILAFGLSKGYVSKVLSIGEMPKSVLHVMAENSDLFGIANAYAAFQYWHTRSRDTALLEKFVARVTSGQLSVREVQKLVDAVASSGGPDAAERTRNRPLSRAEVRSGARGELKVFPDGKVQLNLTEVPEVHRATLFKRLLEALEACGMQCDAVGLGDPE